MPETKWNLVKGETFRPKLDFKQLENAFAKQIVGSLESWLVCVEGKDGRMIESAG